MGADGKPILYDQDGVFRDGDYELAKRQVAQLRRGFERNWTSRSRCRTSAFSSPTATITADASKNPPPR